MLNKIPATSHLIKFWDLVAERREFHHPIPDHIAQYFAPSGRILDFGCGYGRLARQLLDRGFAVSCVDSSPVMLEAARSNAPECEFHCYNNDLPWRDNSFDGVILVTLLTSVPAKVDQRKILDDYSES